MNRLLDEDTIKTSMYSTLVLSYICFLNIAITDMEGSFKYLIIFLSIFFIWYGCKKLYNMFKGDTISYIVSTFAYSIVFSSIGYIAVKYILVPLLMNCIDIVYDIKNVLVGDSLIGTLIYLVVFIVLTVGLALYLCYRISRNLKEKS